MKYVMCLLLAGMMLWFAPAYAAAPAPGDACTVSGQVANDVNSGGAQNVLWCNGTTWQSASIIVGNTVATCDATTKGAIKYDGATTWTYCNGTSFVPFNTAAGTAVTKFQSSNNTQEPALASCTAPACDAGYTNLGCQWGQGEGSSNSSTTYGPTYINLMNRMRDNGFVDSCSHTYSDVPTTAYYNRVTCIRLCKAN